MLERSGGPYLLPLVSGLIIMLLCCRQKCLMRLCVFANKKLKAKQKKEENLIDSFKDQEDIYWTLSSVNEQNSSIVPEINLDVTDTSETLNPIDESLSQNLLSNSEAHADSIGDDSQSAAGPTNSPDVGLGNTASIGQVVVSLSLPPGPHCELSVNLPVADSSTCTSNQIGTSSSDSVVKAYKCSKCHKSFSKFRTAQKHCTPFSWICNSCGTKINKRGNVPRHIKRCERKKEQTNRLTTHEQSTEKYLCDICKKEMKNKNSLRSHIYNMHKETSGDFGCERS